MTDHNLCTSVIRIVIASAFATLVFSEAVFAESRFHLVSVESLAAPYLIFQTGGLQRGGSQGRPGNTQGQELQRGASPTGVNARDTECLIRHAEWERNLALRSMAYGFLLNIFLSYVLTSVRFTTTVIRLFCSIVLSIAFGPLLLGIQKYELFRVCPDPPSFVAVFSADLFLWTLVGIGLTLGLIALVRYFLVIRPKFSGGQIAP